MRGILTNYRMPAVDVPFEIRAIVNQTKTIRYSNTSFPRPRSAPSTASITVTHEQIHAFLRMGENDDDAEMA